MNHHIAFTLQEDDHVEIILALLDIDIGHAQKRK